MESPDNILINGYKHVSYHPETFSEEEITLKSKSFHEWLNKRRSVRDFSDKTVPKEVIENLIKSASTAPSGAHKQPWTFCAISNPALKSEKRPKLKKKRAMITE